MALTLFLDHLVPQNIYDIPVLVCVALIRQTDFRAGALDWNPKHLIDSINKAVNLYPKD